MSGAVSIRAMRAGRTLIFVLSAWTLYVALSPALLQAQQDERSVRVAFIYNLTKYVAWPESTHNLNICVLGAGSTGPALKLVVDGKTSEGRTIHVLLKPTDVELRRCEILYWSESSLGVRPIADKAHGTPVLTVGEDDRFVRDGGMIGFVRSGDSIQIEVNLDSVNAGGLKISSRLLDLALIVHTGKARSR